MKTEQEIKEAISVLSAACAKGAFSTIMLKPLLRALCWIVDGEKAFDELINSLRIGLEIDREPDDAKRAKMYLDEMDRIGADQSFKDEMKKMAAQAEKDTSTPKSKHGRGHR